MSGDRDFRSFYYFFLEGQKNQHFGHFSFPPKSLWQEQSRPFLVLAINLAYSILEFISRGYGPGMTGGGVAVATLALLSTEASENC